MSTRSVHSCLCFSLLAILWAGTPASSEPMLLTGEVGLALSPRSDSMIPVDEAALSRLVCGGGNEEEENGPTAQCKSIAKNLHGGPGGIEALVMPLPNPLITPCGVWSIKLTLSRPHIDPNFPGVLTEVPGDPGRGVFAGVFAMDTYFELTNLETGETVDTSGSLGFSLAGPWTVSTPGESPTNDNLILLADRLDDEVLPFESCVMVTIGPGCRICLLPLMTSSPPAEEGEIQ